MDLSVFPFLPRYYGLTENARLENAGVENVRPKCKGGKCRTGKCGTGNAGKDSVWNIVHCLFLLSPAARTE